MKGEGREAYTLALHCVKAKRLEERGKRQKVSRKSLPLLLLLVLLLQSCQSATMPKGLEVKVTRVVSGQTLEVTSSEPKMSRVRLIGIDAPDLQQQPWGQAAKERLEAIALNQFVLLEFDVQEQDAFGRRIAYVWQDSVLLNEKLVAEGYVLILPRSPNNKYDQRLERAQEWARLMGRGIWHPQKPMRLTPAQFRLQYR